MKLIHNAQSFTIGSKTQVTELRVSHIVQGDKRYIDIRPWVKGDNIPLKGLKLSVDEAEALRDALCAIL